MLIALIVVSSSDPNPIETLQSLYQPQNPPPPFDKGYMDPSIPKYYVVLHDVVRSPVRNIDEHFHSIKMTFGMYCHLVRINSKETALSRHTLPPHQWPWYSQTGIVPASIPTDANAPPVVFVGHFLSEEDLRGVSTFIRELIVQSILPYMESRVSALNEQVAASRRGLTGRLFTAGRKYFSGTSSSSSRPSSSNNINVQPSYPFTTAEAQLRRLADLALVLQDYRFAYSVYDTVRKDFQNDKAYRFAAAVQEMMGVCLAFMDNTRDADASFEASVVAFLSKCASPALATRCTLIAYELARSRGLWRDCQSILFRLANELDSDIRSGVLLEQLSHCYLHAPPASFRKYAFHLVLAGHRFHKCRERESPQPIHALRCYRDALLVYHGKRWSLAEEHVRYRVAQYAVQIGRLPDALHLYVHALRSAGSSANQMQTINELIAVYKVRIFIMNMGKKCHFPVFLSSFSA